MSETEGAIAEREDQEERSLSDIVIAGAGLPADEWNAEKVAAAKKLLPAPARNPAGLIACLSRAQNAGLNLFTGDMHVWEEGGELTFQVAREGWVKILRRDPVIESFEIGTVFAEDDFKWSKDENGKITVDHSGTMRRGDLLGAYCVLHMQDQPDHIEMRLLEDYEHLSYKDNWKNHPQDMLTARVTSAAAKAVSEKAAGLVDEAGMEIGNKGQEVQAARNRQAKEATDDRTAELEEELSEDGDLGREIEAEVKEADEDESPSPEDGPPTEEEVEDGHDVGQGASDVREGNEGIPDTEQGKDSPDATDTASSEETAETPEPSPESSDEEPLESTKADVEPCDLCGRDDFSTPQGKSGHVSGHSKRDETIPQGYKVRQQEGTESLALIAPSGVIVGDDFGSAEAARAAAWEDEGADPAGAAEEADEAPEEDDEPLMSMKGDVPLTELSSGSLFSELYAVEQMHEIDHDRTVEIAEDVAPEKASNVEDFSIMTLDDEEKIEVIRRLHEIGEQE